MRRLTRREFLRNTAVVAGGAYLLSGPLGWACKAAGPVELHEVGWAGRADPVYQEPFERKNNVKIVYKDVFTPPEMTALVSSVPPGTYDVLNTNASETPLLARRGLLLPLDPADYPMDEFLEGHSMAQYPSMVDGKIYHAGESYAALGLSYNTKYVKSEPQSWQICWDKQYKGHVAVYDSWQHHMTWTSISLGFRPPHDISDAQLKEIGDTLISLKPNLIGILGSYGDIITALGNESVWVYPAGGNWCNMPGKRQGVPLDWTIPKEGCAIVTEGTMVLKGAKQEKLARKYTQWMVSAEGAALYSQKKAWLMVPTNKKSFDLLPKDFARLADLDLTQPRNAITIEKGKYIVEQQNPVRQPIDKWIEQWARFKAA